MFPCQMVNKHPSINNQNIPIIETKVEILTSNNNQSRYSDKDLYGLQDTAQNFMLDRIFPKKR